MIGIAGAVLGGAQLAPAASAFHLEEATIADVHRAIRARQITSAQLVNLYFKRIEAYGCKSTCIIAATDWIAPICPPPECFGAQQQ